MTMVAVNRSLRMPRRNRVSCSDSSSLCLLLPLVTAWGKAVKDITFPGEDGEVIAVTDQRDARHTGGLPGRVTTLVPDLRMLFCAGVRGDQLAAARFVQGLHPCPRGPLGPQLSVLFLPACTH